MRDIRCSALPRLAKCAASQIPPTVVVESDGAASRLGSAFHECIADVITSDIADVPGVAAKHNVAVDDLRPMVWWATNQWQTRLKDMFPEPVVEQEYRLHQCTYDIELSGHPDVVSIVGEEARILDWKTGHADDDHIDQLKGYGYLVMSMSDKPVLGVRATVLRVRDQSAETFFWTRQEVERWWQWLCGHLADDQTYRPGSHCGYCPRAFECDAHLAALGTIAGTLMRADQTMLLDAPAENIARGVAKARMVQRAIEQFLQMVKAHVQAQGGTYGPLELVETERKSIDVGRGYTVLNNNLGTHALHEILKVGKGDVEKAVSAMARRGQKGAAIQTLFTALEDAGAMTTTTYTELRIRRTNDSPTIAAIPATADAIAAADGTGATDA